MIVSTGGALLEDVQRAYDAILPINTQLAILQCTAGYPAATEELDLRVISTYRERFPDAVIGFSSHDNGIVMPVAAYMLGARIIEKHFTLNRAMKGTDHAFSLEPVGSENGARRIAPKRWGAAEEGTTASVRRS
jgi:N-acetylneuraminate synthase/sialic acid synthase